jgi:hypothetical protein
VFGVPWRIITGSGLDDWFNTFVHNLSYSQSVIALPLIYPLRKSLGHAILSLATDLSQITVTSSWLFLQLSIPKTRPSSLPITGSVLLQLPASEFASIVTTLHKPNGKHSLYCWRSLFTTSLPSNRCPIVACSCVAGMCLPIHCLAMGIHFKIIIRRFYWWVKYFRYTHCNRS